MTMIGERTRNPPDLPGTWWGRNHNGVFGLHLVCSPFRRNRTGDGSARWTYDLDGHILVARTARLILYGWAVSHRVYVE